MWKIVNIKLTKLCCVCKHWWDPGCSALRPKNTGDFWEFDFSARRTCTVRKSQQPSWAYCLKFERKDF